MKNVYALIAALMTATAVSAAPVLPFGKSHTRQVENAKIQTLNEIPNIAPTKSVSNINKSLKPMPALSRDGSADIRSIDITKFTQNLYMDFFWNFTDADGVTDLPREDEYMRDIQAGSEVTITDNGDETFTIKGLGGYNISFVIERDDDGFVVELGQDVIPQQNGVSYLLAAMGDDGVFFQKELYIPLQTYMNALLIPGDYYFGVLVVRDDQPLGWAILDMFCGFFEPNATLSYNVDAEQPNGQVVTVEVENRVFCQAFEGNEEVDPFITISNIMPWNMGASVTFEYLTIRGIDIIAALDQIASQSESGEDENGEEIETGDFYLSSCTFAANPWVSADGLYPGMALADEIENGIVFPASCDMLGVVDAEKWFLMSDAGYCYEPYNMATLIFDVEEEDGINDVVNDSNSAPVYYNMQGMQIANPQAGQLYIVKQGNKATKYIKR